MLQHAKNPVNWKAWNDKTLELAKKENKLIIISIGYSACHWCHVMEEESFENDSIAKLMNENFINIKVDREERPDIDKIYINAVELMTGSSGWPLNCITLPDGRPIFGGTYFTKKQWEKILIDISKLYKETPEKAIAFANNLTKGMQESNLIALNKEKPSFNNTEIKSAIKLSKQLLDSEYGGFKGAPKFPMPNTIDFLLRYQYHFQDLEVTDYIKNTLTKMAYGGIYDQVGGGFSRYSVDDKWHIPHFEKMLYDNAQLISVYSKAYQVEKNPLYKNVITQTISFIESELDAKNGAFFSSLDADSKNSEGKLEEGSYYAWTEQEIKILFNQDYNLVSDYYNINNYGFWEKDKYVLIKKQSDKEFAKKHQLSLNDLQKKVIQWRKILSVHRNKREKPNLDDKILTSWNALMVQGYVDAYKSLEDPKYLERAKGIANFIIEKQLRKDGGLNRNYKNGKSTINGYLEDYATVIQSFISLYEVTFDIMYLELSKKITSYVSAHFFDDKSSMFYYTSDIDKNLITRKIDVADGVISSANSILANNLFKLGHYITDDKMIKLSEQMLNNLQSEIQSNSLSFANWLNLMISFTNPFYEVAIVGEKAKEVNKSLFHNYIPNIIIVGSNKESKQPLLVNKYVDGQTFIYVCTNGTCKLPQINIKKAINLIKK